MPFEYLEPLDHALVEFVGELPSQSLGRKVVMHTEEVFPETENAAIAIIGVPDNRGMNDKKGHVHLNYIRKELYSLFPGNWDKAIIDFGNIPSGETPQDTYYAVKSILEVLIKDKVVPIVIGGSQDLAYGMYRAYDKLEQMVNLVAIDSRFDFGKEDEPMSARSYLTKIIVDEPNNLFNYSNIGFQTYYNSQEEIDLIEKLYFDAYRLGEISKDPSIAEPVFRDADVVCVDMTAVKSADSGNIVKFIPNGFDGKEICTLARYAGISDKVSSFGIFNQEDTRQEAALIAQVVWYFIEGMHYRSNEYPFGSKEQYLKYIVPMEGEELVFYKSDKTDRWWIDVPFVSGVDNKLKRNTLLPCSYNDYISACNNEFPERLWKAQRKNII
ncbi:formimidoylglutamase [Flavobacterium sp. MFBS3-15]|uniref:formimidoylglutamase n=1 Tax=Flavobacterium sp. MFBS3-15 TaxID=2989816 RepID=UPI002235DBDA|nr:formimidoylglutamase [Flavobacterium sp. MFBS3-15]MCW4469494.1 formimidoylglutamase [Flavobacterium sp. MFBS3-15]